MAVIVRQKGVACKVECSCGCDLASESAISGTSPGRITGGVG